MDEVIALRGLKKRFGTVQSPVDAVAGVDFDFEAGKSYAIVGPSGCGKTTLLNLMGLLLEPSGGEIFLAGKNAVDLTSRERARMRNAFFGYVAQGFLLAEDQSAMENIQIPLLYASPRLSRARRREAVIEAASKTGVADKLGVAASLLSGGQRQRVAIARALVNNPKVILADEPTGSLDSVNSEAVFSLLTGLLTEGRTLVMVTHNLDLAARCDVTVSMLDGKITA